MWDIKLKATNEQTRQPKKQKSDFISLPVILHRGKKCWGQNVGFSMAFDSYVLYFIATAYRGTLF